MISFILKKIFGTKSERDLRKMMPLVKRINALEEEYQKLSEEEKEAVSNLAGKFDREDYEIRKHLDNNATMVEAYKTRFAERDFRIQKRSFLMILKGFSSSTPFFYPALENRFYQSPIKGGGFFLKWYRYGIAVG